MATAQPILSPILDNLRERLAKNTVISDQDIISDIRVNKTNDRKTSVEFVSFENIGISKFTLNYKLKSFDDELLWDTRDLWEEDFLEYLNEKLKKDSSGCLTITDMKISKGSLIFAFNISVLATITAFFGVVNGVIALANNIMSFFKTWRSLRPRHS